MKPPNLARLGQTIAEIQQRRFRHSPRKRLVLSELILWDVWLRWLAMKYFRKNTLTLENLENIPPVSPNSLGMNLAIERDRFAASVLMAIATRDAEFFETIAETLRAWNKKKPQPKLESFASCHPLKSPLEGAVLEAVLFLGLWDKPVPIKSLMEKLAEVYLDPPDETSVRDAAKRIGVEIRSKRGAPRKNKSGK